MKAQVLGGKMPSSRHLWPRSTAPAASPAASHPPRTRLGRGNLSAGNFASGYPLYAPLSGTPKTGLVCNLMAFDSADSSATFHSAVALATAQTSKTSSKIRGG